MLDNSPPTGDAPAPAPGVPEAGDRPVYSGRLGALYKLFLVNLLLTIVTLGVYRFWAKTRVRQYLWRHLAVRGEAFEYTGTGKELFIGFLKAALLLAPVFIGLAFLEVLMARLFTHGDAVVAILRTILVVWLIYVGSFAALRYRMSRTLWRGIRFLQNGSPWHYGTRALGYMVLSALTLGFYSPYMNVKLQGYAMNNLGYGSARFRFDGEARDLVRRFVIAWFLFIPTLGLSLLWYSAFKTTYFTSRTKIEGVSFAMKVTGGALFRLIFGNLLLLIVSLGLLWPIVLGRNIRFVCERLTIAGDLDFAEVSQQALNTRDREGVASFLDTEIGIG